MIHGGPSAIYASTKGTITLSVRWRYVNQCDVEVYIALFEQARYLKKKNRNTIGMSCIHRGPHVTTDEKTIGSEMF
jgi:DUF1680 family protein